MITRETVIAVQKLYNKMFKGILPAKKRFTYFEDALTMECLRLYGRKSVVYVFRAVMSEPFICKNEIFFTESSLFVDYQHIFSKRNYCRYLNMYFKNKNSNVNREQVVLTIKRMRSIARANRVACKELLDNVLKQKGDEE